MTSTYLEYSKQPTLHSFLAIASWTGQANGADYQHRLTQAGPVVAVEEADTQADMSSARKLLM